ncbi:hypothetical protein [uncultured Nocardioides sp.]|uniref:hypothetical protein n=1 Tax=uncultured Nocardioides sp. TaxID=198441 RepID=UPI0025D049BD|nr:hypothetical protein [uncultured Nocardioides sp.]
MIVTDASSRAEQRTLRAAVLELKQREPRGRFTLRVHAGLPGGADCWFEAGRDDHLDHTVRTDVAAALLHRARSHTAHPWAWTTRPGPLCVGDADLAWSAAGRAALAEADLPLRFVVVTRHGWLDPVTGAGQAWRRLRRRS